MVDHIGIVGCSSEGAALCYRTICLDGARLLGTHAHPEISMHTHKLSAYVECLKQDDLNGVAALMLSSATKLANAGADFLICPDNTVHAAMDLVLPQSPLPWLHIAEIVAERAQQRGFHRLGLTGTAWLVNSTVYPEKLQARNIDYRLPTASECREMDRIIMTELVQGVFRPDAVAFFSKMMTRLKEAGCDAVVLGCTEIPLLISDANTPLPTLDSTRLLARAALDRAVGGALEERQALLF